MAGCSQLVCLCKYLWFSNISNNDKKEKVTFFASGQQIKGKSKDPGHPIHFQICSRFGSLGYE